MSIRRPVRRLLPLAVLCAAGIAASACDLSPPAATVGSHTITRAQLDDQLGAIVGSAYAQCALQLQGVNLPTPLTGVGDATVNSSFSTFELSTLVLERLVDNDLAAHHTQVTAGDLSAARTDFANQLTPTSSASPCPGQLSGEHLVQVLPADFRKEQVAFLAAQERLAATIGKVDVSTGALEAYYRSHPTEFDEVCLSDIAVETQAQAQQVHDAIAKGSSTFAAEAEQNSIDTQTAQSGGTIPCVPRSQIVNGVILSAIDALSTGQISPPVFEPQTGSGGGGVWFVLRLDGRPRVPFAQAESEIRQQLLSAQNASVSTEFTRLTREAHVDVDPRYGTWSAARGVEPPRPPAASYLLAPSADQATGSVFGNAG